MNTQKKIENDFFGKNIIFYFNRKEKSFIGFQHQTEWY